VPAKFPPMSESNTSPGLPSDNLSASPPPPPASVAAPPRARESVSESDTAVLGEAITNWARFPKRSRRCRTLGISLLFAFVVGVQGKFPRPASRRQPGTTTRRRLKLPVLQLCHICFAGEFALTFCEDSHSFEGSENELRGV
jgi:hypothetical protein